MKNADQPRSFFNWQGNNLSYNYIGNYLVVGIVVATFFLSIIFKKQLRSYFSKKKAGRVLFFSNINAMLQTLGFVMIFIWTFRIFILSFYDYPLVYEHIGLHICRMHFILISIILAFRKKEYIKYLFYISFIASIIGIGFGSTSFDLTKPNNIYIEKGFSYYNAGADTHYYWDYHITHLLTGVLPTIITIGINKKYTTVEFYRTMLAYIAFAIFAFAINALTDLSPDRGWRANYWYLGRDRNNRYQDFFGIFTKWPQNLFSLIAFGISYFYIFQIIYFAIGNNFKSDVQKFLKDHNKKICKKIFAIRAPRK